MTDVKEITAALAEPFDPKDVKWKPQSVKGNRALAMAFIDARAVQDRLDEVLGVENWQDDYQVLPDGSVTCRLQLFVGGQWICKMDVGSLSEQPDAGDRLKAAFSDALKRTAVKFGIGRYLYRLQAQWVDYDATKRQFVSTPQLPPFAMPKGKKPTPGESPLTLCEKLAAELRKSGTLDKLKVAYEKAYHAHDRGHLSKAQFDELTRIKDEEKAKIPPAQRAAEVANTIPGITTGANLDALKK